MLSTAHRIANPAERVFSTSHNELGFSDIFMCHNALILLNYLMRVTTLH